MLNLLKEIDKSLSNPSLKYDHFIFLGDLNFEPTKSAIWDFWNLIIETQLKKTDLPTLPV